PPLIVHQTGSPLTPSPSPTLSNNSLFRPIDSVTPNILPHCTHPSLATLTYSVPLTSGSAKKASTVSFHRSSWPMNISPAHVLHALSAMRMFWREPWDCGVPGRRSSFQVLTDARAVRKVERMEARGRDGVEDGGDAMSDVRFRAA